MQRYVVGFMFNNSEDRVILIKKNRPSWQVGLLNGVGGRVEDSESIENAMIREFQEETGITHLNWRHYCELSDAINFEVHFFRTIGPVQSLVEGMTDEEVLLVKVSDVHKIGVQGDELNLVPNLRWLIPMALDKARIRARVLEPPEGRRESEDE